MKKKATWAVLLSALVIIAWGCSQTSTFPGADHPNGKSVTGVNLGMGDGGMGGGCDSCGHGGMGGGCDSSGMGGMGGCCDSTGHGGKNMMHEGGGMGGDGSMGGMH